MADILVKKETEVDWISEPTNLVNAAPTFAGMLTEIQDERARAEEIRKLSNARRAVGMSAGGNMMRIACFPHDLLCAIYKVNPFFMKNKREFYQWLNKHPYYRVGGML